MSAEQEQYGKGWEHCSNCGVKDRADQLEKVDGKVVHIAKRATKCAEWKQSLAKAKPADLEQAAAQLVDAGLAEVNKT